MAKDKDFNNAAKKLVAGQNDANEVSWTVRDAQILLSRLTEYIEADISRKAALHEKLSPAIKSLIAEFGIIGTIERMRRAIEMDRNRPRDMSIYQFIRSPDLFDVGGEFSTFDADIVKMKKNGAPASQLRKSVSAAMTNKEEVALEYIRILKQFVANNVAMYKEARANTTHGDRVALEKFLQKLSDVLMGNFGLDGLPLSVKVVDSWKNVPTYLKNTVDVDGKLLYGLHAFVEKDGLPAEFYIYINRAERVRQCTGIKNCDAFNMIMGTFMHEFGHFVDYILPNRGMIGIQKMMAATKVYVGNKENYEEYRENPTEVSSDFIARAVRGYLNTIGKDK